MTTFAYDVMNRFATRTDPLGQTETFTYDLAGNLINFTDRRGQTSQFSYDELETELRMAASNSAVMIS